METKGYWTYNRIFNVYEQVRGHRIVIKGFEWFDLFVSPYMSDAGYKCYGVYGGHTGGVIGQGMRLKEAIEEARNNLFRCKNHSSLVTMRYLVEMIAARYGQSPRHKEDRS